MELKREENNDQNGKTEICSPWRCVEIPKARHCPQALASELKPLAVTGFRGGAMSTTWLSYIFNY